MDPGARLPDPTAARQLDPDESQLRRLLRHCERQRHADPWTHLLIPLPRRARRKIPSGYPTKLTSRQSTPSESSLFYASHYGPYDGPLEARSITELCASIDRLSLDEGMRASLERRARSERDNALAGISSTSLRNVPERNDIGLFSRYLSDFPSQDNRLTIHSPKDQRAHVPVSRASVGSSDEASNESMFSFNRWLDWTGTVQSGATSSGSAPGVSASNCDESMSDVNGGPHSNELTPVTLKRLQGDGEDEEGGDEKRRWQLRCKDPSERPVACPYLKYDPFGANRQRCNPRGYLYKDLKQHLKRCHGPQFACWLCGHEPGSYNKLVKHILTPHTIVLSVYQNALHHPQNTDGRHDQATAALLSVREVGKTTEQKWTHIYKVLFPHVADHNVPSPYPDDVHEDQSASILSGQLAPIEPNNPGMADSTQPGGDFLPFPTSFQPSELQSPVDNPFAQQSDFTGPCEDQGAWEPCISQWSGDPQGPYDDSSNCHATGPTSWDDDYMSVMASLTDNIDYDTSLAGTHDEGGKGKGIASWSDMEEAEY
ncbi:hypothetical protein CONLIGDRAFT_644172 [Coniochaeta ligniaria NRRL 30616]|uniref:C2H2-type domain-containing protein n=1 Tax=Coniochaeta ligniaria NRRL 30616 TaxID=1408157 RepID=A0A1J7IRP8_9PEZI|nr:hypothetical protein CONLIGDRAFT_644172 [Coniochaeta ligniaria NRRL 30616]